MCAYRFALVVCAVGFPTLLPCSSRGQAVPPPPPPGGVEVLSRGPVHEAFAQVPDTTPLSMPVVATQPPNPINEVPPDQKPSGENVQWIPGYWAWDPDQSTYVWVSGMWRVFPPGRQWVPGHWQQVAGGWQWISGLWSPLGQTELVVQPVPPAVPAQQPAASSSDATSTYVPGTWILEVNRYVWRPGFWVAYHPGWVWTPAHYVWMPSGCIFVDGFWDYPLESRGLLFAPVRIGAALLVHPNWAFTPQYVVSTQTLTEALFVGPRLRHYYFGDYFGPRYQQRGFVFWADYGIKRHAPDILYSYYRHRPGGERWEHDLRALHEEWHRGHGTLPPRTLVEQNRAIENLRHERNVNPATVNRVTVVRPLGQLESHGVKVVHIPRQQHEEARKSTEWYRQVQHERQAHAAQVIAKGRPPVEHGAAASRIRLPQAPHPAPTPMKAPPAPVMPKHVEKPH